MSVFDFGKFVSSLKSSLLLYQIKKKEKDIYKITVRELSFWYKTKLFYLV